jgi:hypothetical protein
MDSVLETLPISEYKKFSALLEEDLYKESASNPV